jgi:hypothetical protein
MITQEELLKLVEYKDSNLYWLKTQSPRAVKGTVAGSKNSNNYYRIGINKTCYCLHRIIWIYHYGAIPEKMEIDHINNNPSDNRIENLRLATRLQNEYNKPKKGYRFEAGKWRAKIKVDGKQKHLGMFDTEDDARLAYLIAAKQIQKHFAYRSAL